MQRSCEAGALPAHASCCTAAAYLVGTGYRQMCSSCSAHWVSPFSFSSSWAVHAWLLSVPAPLPTSLECGSTEPLV